jgi:hypothetical protein
MKLVIGCGAASNTATRQLLAVTGLRGKYVRGSVELKNG